MEIRWMRAFVAVAEELHFGNAAIRLGMAQSPLSQIIRKLEDALGVELFFRTTRSVELTAAGHALLPHARTILEEVELAQQSVNVQPDEVYGKVTFGFSGVLNHRTLPILTRALRDSYPQIELTLEGRIMTQEAVDRLEAGTLDVAFVGHPVDARRVESIVIARERYGLVVPADHPGRDHDRLELSMFADEPFITPPSAAGSVLYADMLRACQDAGFQPIIGQQITDGYMAMMLVAAGMGVAYLPSSVAAVVPPGTVFLPIDDPVVYLRHGLAWAKRPGSEARDVFIELARQVLPAG